MAERSEYLIQVVERESGRLVSSWEPGLRVEKSLITELLQRVKDKGVGLARTEAHVLEDVRTAFEELLHDLKSWV
jgi:hypothetical protein